MTTYKFYKLGVSGNGIDFFAGINTSGVIVGDTDFRQGAIAFQDINSVFTYLDDASNITAFYGINDSGAAVGGEYGNTERAFLYKAGSIMYIPDLTGYVLTPYAISNNNNIVGQAVSENDSRGFLYRNGAYSTIAVPSANTTIATGINDAGDVVGNYSNGPGSEAGFLLHNGQYMPIAFPGAAYTAVQSINNEGQISGYFDNGSVHSFVLKNNLFEVFKYPGNLIANSIANNGVFLGSIESGTSTPVLAVPQGAAAPSSGQLIASNTFDDATGALIDDKVYGTNGAETDTSYDLSGVITAQSVYSNGSLVVGATVTHLADGKTVYHYVAGSSLQGKPYATFTNTFGPYGGLLEQKQVSGDGSVYLDFKTLQLSNGNIDYHYAGGSFFTGKSFASFDNVTNAAGTLLSQTLDNASGQATQQTQYNGDGSVFQQDTITYPASGQALHHYGSGSFFNDKSFSAFDNLITGGTLLKQELYNRDSSHSFSVPGSTLTIAAAHKDTFTITGHNDTIRFGATGFGADTVKGYTSGDKVSFAPSVFSSYADLSSHVSGTSSAVLTDTHGDTVTLAGVAASSLNSSMFAFG